MWKYCTKSEVAAMSGLAESVFDDSWSQMAEEYIDEYTGETYTGSTAYTESLDGDGISDTMILKHTPVISVTSVSIDGVALQSSDYKVYESGYIRLVSTTGSALDKATGSVGSVFPEGQQNVVIVYNAGVTSVPAYVKLAAILCISEIAVFSERAGANASLAVSRASQRAGDGAAYQTAAALAGKMRTIVRNTIGQKWRFK